MRLTEQDRAALVEELTALVVHGSDSKYAVMAARVKVKEVLARHDTRPAAADATATDADTVERVAEAIAEMYPPRDNKHDGYIKPVWDMADIEDLAEHALSALPPSPSGADVDALLDSVHPMCRITQMAPADDGWKVRIEWPKRTENGIVLRWSYVVAYGDSRAEAVAKAVAGQKRSPRRWPRTQAKQGSGTNDH